MLAARSSVTNERSCLATGMLGQSTGSGVPGCQGARINLVAELISFEKFALHFAGTVLACTLFMLLLLLLLLCSSRPVLPYH